MRIQKSGLSPDKFLSDYEVEYLERLLKRHLKVKDYRRDALIISVALRTGARAQEILNLKVSDFDLEKDTLFFRGLKGSNDRSVPVPEWLSRALRFHIRQISDGGSMWDISYTRLRQIWMNYRPVKKKFHALRHTFAVRAYMKTKDIRLVQNVLGHRNITNTLVYLDYVHSINEMRRILF